MRAKPRLWPLPSCDVEGRRRRFKDHFFFPAGKRTVFGIQRKRGSRGGQVAPNRFSAARLYAPIEVRPRPQWTTPVEQGQAVVLSHIFSPPAQAGVGTWRRCPVFPLLWGAASSFYHSLFTFLSSFYLWGASFRMRPRNTAPPGRGNQINKRSAPAGALLSLRCYAASAAGSVLLSAAGKRSS